MEQARGQFRTSIQRRSRACLCEHAFEDHFALLADAVEECSWEIWAERAAHPRPRLIEYAAPESGSILRVRGQAVDDRLNSETHRQIVAVRPPENTLRFGIDIVHAFGHLSSFLCQIDGSVGGS
jgi:hypothetical protein